MHRGSAAPRGADRLHLQDQDAGLRSRDVRDHQRHRPERGTEHEQRRPFEVFINSKNLDHYQWIVALTRIISAVFRKGGDVTFLVEELKAVFDPRGGYWQPAGKFMPSIIAELGYVIEKHLQTIGLIRKVELDEHQKKLVDESAPSSKRAASRPMRSRSPFPRRRAAVLQVQHRRRRHDGRLHDLPELRRLEVRDWCSLDLEIHLYRAARRQGGNEELHR
jgi:hypothetical protein